MRTFLSALLILASSSSAFALNKTSCTVKLNGKIVFANSSVWKSGWGTTVLVQTKDVKIVLQPPGENDNMIKLTATLPEKNQFGERAWPTAFILGQQMPYFFGSQASIVTTLQKIGSTQTLSIDAVCTHAIAH